MNQEIKKEELISFLSKHWGSHEIVSRGKKVDATSLPRIIKRNKEGEITALAVYSIDKENSSCELVAMATTIKRKGIGTSMLSEVEDIARKSGCKKIWLITTNDNLEAVNFYIKRDYRLIAVHLDALDESRKLKPEIPLFGNHNLPLRDEWEFQKEL